MSKQTKTQAAKAAVIDEKPTNVIDNETGEITSLKVSEYSITDGGEKFDLNDVATEIVDLQARHDAIQRRAETVSRHMVAIAAKCGGAPTFRALCSLIEEQRHWGRAPKGTPDHIKKLYQPMPKIWTQYKSKILSSLEAGIKPLSEQTFTRKLRKPDAEGNKEVTEKVKLDSVHYLDKARRELVAKTEQKAAPKAGIIIGKGGKEHRQPLPDMKLGTLLAEVAELYEQSSPASQKEVIKRLQALAQEMREHLPKRETKEQKAG